MSSFLVSLSASEVAQCSRPCTNICRDKCAARVCRSSSGYAEPRGPCVIGDINGPHQKYLLLSTNMLRFDAKAGVGSMVGPLSRNRGQIGAGFRPEAVGLSAPAIPCGSNLENGLTALRGAG